MTALAVEAQLRQYVLFTLRSETYALAVEGVREIIQYLPVTPVPQAPPELRGVMNLRGTVIPVLDPAVKFGFPAAGPTRYTCVLVAELAQSDGSRSPVGLVVDAVQQVLDLEPQDILPVPPIGTGVPGPNLAGIARIGERFIPILDLDRLLTLGSAAGASGGSP